MSATIVALGIVAFLILLFAFFTYSAGGNNKNEHIYFRILLIIVFLNILMIIPSANTEKCDVYLTRDSEFYEYGDNFTTNSPHWDDHSTPPNPAHLTSIYLFKHNTTYTYEYLCFKDNTGFSRAFFQQTQYLYYAFWVYILLYLSWKWLTYKQIIGGRKV